MLAGKRASGQEPVNLVDNYNCFFHIVSLFLSKLLPRPRNPRHARRIQGARWWWP
jgi:hypothetical protein